MRQDIRTWSDEQTVEVIKDAKVLNAGFRAMLWITAHDGTEYLARYRRRGTPIGDAVADRRKELDKDAEYMDIPI